MFRCEIIFTMLTYSFQETFTVVLEMLICIKNYPKCTALIPPPPNFQKKFVDI